MNLNYESERMSNQANQPSTPPLGESGSTSGDCRNLSPAAQRALAEAEARRKAIDERQRAMPREIDGRGGLDPARYDDWEVKGIASDF